MPEANEVFLVSIKNPEREYKVLMFDKEKKVMKLRSRTGKVFMFPEATKAAITEAGYELVQR